MWQLYDGTCNNFGPQNLLEEYTITAPLQNSWVVVEWSTAYNNVFQILQTLFSTMTKFTLSTEDNACGNNLTPVTGVTLGNSNICRLHDMSNQGFL